jgi:hypothetical protein
VIAITAIGTKEAPVWRNVFGLKDFNLVSFSMNVGYVAGFPELGMSGTASIPSSVTRILGVPASTTITATVSANLSAANPCVALAIAADDGVSNIVNIANGAITAKDASFAIAPFGCTIGAGDFAATYPEGVSLAFSGSFMSLKVAASLSIITSDLAFTISGSISVGAITLGKLKLDSTIIEISLGTAVGAEQKFKFSGGATLLGAKLSVSAAATWYVVNPLVGSVQVTVSVSRMTVGGFGLEDVYFTFNLGAMDPQNFEMSFGAKIPILPGVMLAATGKLTPTQLYVNVNATINWGSFAVLARGTVYLGESNGSTIYTASVTIGLRILDQDITAALVISTDATGAHYLVQFQGLNFPPFAAMYLTLYADCDWDGFPGGVSMGGRIDASFNFGVLAGSITGTATLGTNSAGKKTLLMDLTATATLSVSWVAAVTTTVHFSTCNATCTASATPILQIRATTTWLGNAVDTGWQTISIPITWDGSFSINASSDFTRSSGIVYGCDTSDRGSNCDSDPKTVGLLRWQASFTGSASFTFSSSGGLSVATSASAEVQQSASTCPREGCKWGSFTKLANMNISIDLSSGSLKGRYAGRDYSA